MDQYLLCIISGIYELHNVTCILLKVQTKEKEMHENHTCTHVRYINVPVLKGN